MVLQTIALPLGDRATGLEEFQTAKEGDRDSFAASSLLCTTNFCRLIEREGQAPPLVRKRPAADGGPYKFQEKKARTKTSSPW